MISSNWQIVLLDFVIIVDLFMLALWFSGDFARWTFLIISTAFTLIAGSQAILMIGDVLIALGYDATDTWLLERAWRALSWRYGAAIGFTLINGVLRFGRFNGGKKN